MNSKNTNNLSFVNNLRKTRYNPQPSREPQRYTGRKKYFSEYGEQDNLQQNATKSNVKSRKEKQPIGKSHLDRYSKASTLPSRSYINYSRAPKGQFKKYLDDSENVFWENRPEIKKLRLLNSLKYSLLVLIFLLMGTYWLIGRLQPYPKAECPHNSQCGVFIHCKKGYVLENKRCIIDPSLKLLAQNTCQAVVQQLQLDYGNQDCGLLSNFKPQTRIREVLDEFEIKDPLLQQEVYQFFENPKKQQQLGFNVTTLTVTPTKKQYSLACKFKIFADSPSFYLVVAALILGSIGGGYLIRQMLFRRKAIRAYQYLKDRVLSSDFLLIQEEKGAVLNLVKEWNDPLWSEIDRLRCQDRKIVYYCEHEQLYWKKIEEL